MDISFGALPFNPLYSIINPAVDTTNWSLIREGQLPVAELVWHSPSGLLYAPWNEEHRARSAKGPGGQSLAIQLAQLGFAHRGRSTPVCFPGWL